MTEVQKDIYVGAVLGLIRAEFDSRCGDSQVFLYAQGDGHRIMLKTLSFPRAKREPTPGEVRELVADYFDSIAAEWRKDP